MVVTKHPLAPAVGAEMLAAGGNAVDAAVAALVTLTAVEPAMFGILCGGFANPHRLQLKATSLSWPQSSQRSLSSECGLATLLTPHGRPASAGLGALRKRCARMPHAKNVSNSSFTICGRSTPVAASVSAKKVSACC